MEGCFIKWIPEHWQSISTLWFFSRPFHPCIHPKIPGFPTWKVGKNMHFQCLMCLFLLPSYELSEVPPIAAMHSDLSWEKCDLQAVQAAKRQQKKDNQTYSSMVFLIDESSSKFPIPITNSKKKQYQHLYTRYFCSIIIGTGISMNQINDKSNHWAPDVKLPLATERHLETRPFPSRDFSPWSWDEMSAMCCGESTNL